ncbi:O-antigen polymerase [Bizionia sp.]|uniref:O-antigen polymerase n=1 Tax=Bizionia sp. TaxID=1954480 RepID=UPI003A94810E
MNLIKTYWLFFGSLTVGLLIWVLAYMLLPLEAVQPIKTKTILFIVSCYIAIIAGFVMFNFKTITNQRITYNNQKVVKLLLIIIVVSFALRWYDLFVNRNLSFANDLKFNRFLNDDNFKQNQVLLIVASVLKSLYFFPFVICIRANLKRPKFYIIASYIVLFFPLLEAILKGTRKPFFEIFLIIVFTFIAYQKPKINFKRISITVIAVVILMSISMLILLKRENYSENFDDTFYKSLLESRYNEILKPTDAAINYFETTNHSQLTKLYVMSGLHTGQYITHGAFEFNHIIDIDSLSIGYGMYNYSIIPKFFNKISLSSIPIANLSPRKYVYLTQFGSYYIDFRWFSLVLMFLFGVFQKYIYQKSFQSVIYSPILMYFLIINVFLMILSYTRGAGIYVLFGFLFLLFLLKIFEKKLHEESISS